MESLKKIINSTLKTMDNNKIIDSVIGLVLILYAALAAPKLPKSVAKVFDSDIVKIIYMFMIGYLATRNPSVSIIAAVGLFITLQTITAHEVANKVVEMPKGQPVVFNPVLNPPTELPVVKLPEVVVSEVPLSPERKMIVDEAVSFAQIHQEEAAKAKQEGNIPLAEAHTQEAVKQQLIAESAVKVKELTIQEEQAKAEGNFAQAESHALEANKENIKLTSLLNASKEKQIAIQEEQSGNIVKAEEHKLEAAKQETIASSLIKAEIHAEQAVKAESEGNKELANVHAEEAKKNQVIAESLLKADTSSMKAIVAEEKGDLQTAKELKKSAAIEETKAMALINASDLKEAAVKAIQEGNVALAEVHKAEAANQEMKATSLIKAEEIKQIANMVAAQGKESEAKVLNKIADTEVTKVKEMVKSEKTAEALQEAKTSGDTVLIQQLMDKTIAHNEKIKLINEAQEKRVVALENERNGNVSEANKLKKEAKAIINKAKRVVVPSVNNVRFGSLNVNETESPLESETEMKPSVIAPVITKVVNNVPFRYDISGYGGSDYALI